MIFISVTYQRFLKRCRKLQTGLNHSHSMGLEDINEAFELMHEGKSIRTVIHY